MRALLRMVPVDSWVDDEGRHRIFEILELFAYEERQRELQAKRSFLNVPDELFNQWDDWYHPNGARFLSRFSREERDVLRQFAEVVDDVASRTPHQLPKLEAFVRTYEWEVLRKAANEALKDLGVPRKSDF